MNTINLTFNKPFLKMAKNYQMTPLQVLQHMVSSLSFCHFYNDGITIGIDVSAVDLDIIEEVLKGTKIVTWAKFCLGILPH